MIFNHQDRQSLYRGPIDRQPPPIYRAVSKGEPFPINRGRLPINRTSIRISGFPYLMVKVHSGCKPLPILIGKFHYRASYDLFSYGMIRFPIKRARETSMRHARARKLSAVE